jgi:cobalamin biosynthesis Co2+ chelatase CbiK
MKTINIKGKEYVTVNERLKEFRNNFKDYALITEIIELGSDYATVKASIFDDKGVLRATGFAREVTAKSPINKYAFLENCETSAIGRALGNFGIGIDEAVCTADELIQKLSYEDKSEPKPEKTDFEKTATADKRANTMSVKKAINDGKDELPGRTAEKLKDDFTKTLQHLVNIKSWKNLNNTQIDFINRLLKELHDKGYDDEYDKLSTLYNKLQSEELADEIQF